MKKIAYLYFSYNADYQLLCHSIDSLHETHKTNAIYVFEDPEKRFANDQRNILVHKGVKILTHPLGRSPSNGNGLNTVKAQLQAMKLVLDKEKAEFVAKIDSDTYFISEFIDSRFLSTHALVGHEVAYKGESNYIYGNLYFMSKQLISYSLNSIDNKSVTDNFCCDTKNYFAENRVIYELYKSSKLPGKIYKHDEGFSYNVDLISNIRVSYATKTKIFFGYNVFNPNHKAIHFWSSNKLLARYLAGEKIYFSYELTKLNMLNLINYLKHLLSKALK